MNVLALPIFSPGDQYCSDVVLIFKMACNKFLKIFYIKANKNYGTYPVYFWSCDRSRPPHIYQIFAEK